MNRFVPALTNPRFLRWVVFPHALFFAVAWWTDARDLIGVLNPVDNALSVAFLPSLEPLPIDLSRPR